MNKLIIVRGIPASGKTTVAKKIVAENPNNTVRYNWDSLRDMMGVYLVPEREKLPFLKENRKQFLDFWMNAGWNIVVDNTNLNPKDIKYYEDLITKYNSEHTRKYEIEYINCFTPVEECIRRDSIRPNPIGEKVIKDFWKRYRDFIIGIENQEYSKQFNKEYDFNKPNAIIVDLDATIALNLQSRPFFGEDCAKEIHKDIPILPTIHIIENFNGEVLFLTGRDEACREETDKWIKSHTHLSNYKLFMRPNGDYSPGVEFKVNIYKKFIEPYYNIEFVLEDSNKIVDAFRNLNLFVLQPNKGTY